MGLGVLQLECTLLLLKWSGVRGTGVGVKVVVDNSPGVFSMYTKKLTIIPYLGPFRLSSDPKQLKSIATIVEEQKTLKKKKMEV